MAQQDELVPTIDVSRSPFQVSEKTPRTPVDETRVVKVQHDSSSTGNKNSVRTETKNSGRKASSSATRAISESVERDDDGQSGANRLETPPKLNAATSKKPSTKSKGKSEGDTVQSSLPDEDSTLLSARGVVPTDTPRNEKRSPDSSSVDGSTKRDAVSETPPSEGNKKQGTVSKQTKVSIGRSNEGARNSSNTNHQQSGVRRLGNTDIPNGKVAQKVPKAVRIDFNDGAVAKKKALKRPSKIAPKKSQNQSNYVDTKDLRPIEDKQIKGAITKGLAVLLQENQDAKWQLVVDALLLLRRLVVHHPQSILDAQETSGIVSVLCKSLGHHIRNLRSVVAKNAIMASQDLCSALKMKVGSGVQWIAMALIQRSVDTNAFIKDSAIAALATVSAKCATSTVVGTLVEVYQGKPPLTQKKQVAFFLLRTLESMSRSRLEHVKKLQQLVEVVSAMFEDPSSELRQIGKSIIVLLTQAGVIYPRNIRTLVNGPVLYRFLREMEQVDVTTNAGGTKVTASTPKASQQAISRLATPKVPKLTIAEDAESKSTGPMERVVSKEKQQQAISRLSAVPHQRQRKIHQPSAVERPSRSARTTRSKPKPQVKSLSARKRRSPSPTHQRTLAELSQSPSRTTNKPPAKKAGPREAMGSTFGNKPKAVDPKVPVRQSKRGKQAELLHLSRKQMALERVAKEAALQRERALPPSPSKRLRLRFSSKPKLSSNPSQGYVNKFLVNQVSGIGSFELKEPAQEHTRPRVPISPLASVMSNEEMATLCANCEVPLNALEAAESIDSAQLAEALRSQWISTISQDHGVLEDINEVYDPVMSDAHQEMYDPGYSGEGQQGWGRIHEVTSHSETPASSVSRNKTSDIVELGEYSYGLHGELIPILTNGTGASTGTHLETSTRSNMLEHSKARTMTGSSTSFPALSNPNRPVKLKSNRTSKTLPGFKSRKLDMDAPIEVLERQLLDELGEINKLIRERRKSYKRERIPLTEYGSMQLSPHYEALIA